MANIAENDRKEGIRTRQGFGELKRMANSLPYFYAYPGPSIFYVDFTG